MSVEFFKFGPDWKTGITETLTFLTDILTSRNGTEQRRSLRTKPRRQLSYTATLTGSDIPDFEQFMWAHQAGLVHVPDWCARRELSAPAVQGSAEIAILAADDPKAYTFEDGVIPPDMTVVSGQWVVQSGGMPHPVAGEKRLSGTAFGPGVSEVKLSSAGVLFPAELEFSYDMYASSPSPTAPSFEVIVGGQVLLAVTPPGTQSSWVIARLTIEGPGDIIFRVRGNMGFANASLGHVKWSYDTPGNMNDFRVGKAVALISRSAAWASNIESISGNLVTLEDPLPTAWPTGSSVFPLLEAALPDAIQTTLPASGVQRASMAFDQVIDGYSPPKTRFEADLVIRDRMGRYVEALVRPINWAYGLSVDLSYAKGSVDGQSGRVGYEFAIRQPTRALKATVLMRNKDEIGWWKAFFDRMKGRRDQFVAPTWQQDLALVPPGPNSYSGTKFVVKGTALGMSWGRTYRSDVYTHIFVKKKDGTKAFYRIYTASPNTEDDTTTISTEDWLESYSPDEAPFACLACCLRLASDTMTINWRTGTVAEMELAAVTTVLQQKVT